MYAEWIYKAVRQNLGLEPDDTSQDEEINAMSKQEVFDRFLTWQGIIGYSNRILSALEKIYGVDFEEIERSGNND